MVVEVTSEENENCCCVKCDYCICDEFQRTSLTLEYPKPRDMVTCQVLIIYCKDFSQRFSPKNKSLI